jgi:hypothetical protein
MAGKGVRCEAEYSLQLGDPLRPRHGLTSKPLRDRRLRDAQCGSQSPLGQPALGSRAPERPSEVLPLIGRRHVRVLSQVGAS